MKKTYYFTMGIVVSIFTLFSCGGGSKTTTVEPTTESEESLSQESLVLNLSQEERLEIAKRYNKMEYLKEGLARVQAIDNTKYGFINVSGKEVIPCVYDDSGEFCEGLAWAKKGGKYGFIDKNGKEVIPFMYDGAGDFYAGLAWAKKGGKYGFIDKNGKEIIPFMYDEAKRFNEGLAAVNKNGKWGFVDKTGKLNIPLVYSDASSFAEGVACVMNNSKKWGYIDKTGKVVIKMNYDIASSFANGYARVVNEFGSDTDEYAFINKENKVVYGPYRVQGGRFMATDPTHGWYLASKQNLWFVPCKDENGNHTQGVFNIETGGILFYTNYVSGGRLFDEMGFFATKGVVDKNGVEIVPSTYEWVYPLRAAGFFRGGSDYYNFNGEYVGSF